MDLTVLVVIILIVMGVAAVSMAMGSENRTKTDYEKSKAERERAAKERETALVVSANQQAVTLERLRQETKEKIMSADQQALTNIYSQIEDRGGLVATFSLHHQLDGKAKVKANWSWEPFGNSAFKIYKNRGSLIEDPKDVVQHCDLVKIDNKLTHGEYIDGDTKTGETYNYYAFVELKYHGFTPENVKRNVPESIRQGGLIDSQGNEIRQFNTFEPKEYEESIFFGFHAVRITVEDEINPMLSERKSLDLRKDRMELKKYAAKIAQMEDDLEISEGDFDEKSIAILLERAKATVAKRKSFEELISTIEADSDLDEEEKEELIETINQHVK